MSVTLDLRKIPVYWVTVEKNIDRHKSMRQMFESIGFLNTTQVNGEVPPVMEKSSGVAKSHIDSLCNGLPVLVFEDDCKATPEYKNLIRIPAGADAIYLGTSIYGMLKGVPSENGCISSGHDEEYVRVYNMLGMHAVLYLTERYRQHVIDALSKFIEAPTIACDIPVAMGMKNYNVYAVRKPMFYQNDGHNERVTLTPLEPLF